MWFDVDRIWLKMQLNKILWITAAWTIISSFQFLYEISVLSTLDCLHESFDFWIWWPINIVTGIFAGLFGGSITVFFFEKWFRTRPYWLAFLMVLAAYSVVFFIVANFGYQLLSDSNTQDVASTGPSLIEWVTSIDFLKSYVLWFFVTIGTVVVLLVNDKYGPGILLKMLLGKYFKPHREERIFMFLDLRDSTAIAEMLSEEDYFKLLHEIIIDATQPILNARGEIYQYVGDEIVISWPIRKGKHNTNCLKCFREVQQAFKRRAPYYLETFGVIPEYKAGLHYGHVVAGEIGVVKRDVTYTGDVLNTTSRIQGMCNELGVDMLLSKHLLDKLDPAPHQYNPRRIGEIALKGKREEIILYTV